MASEVHLETATAFVVGASAGIGLAIARQLAGLGAGVAMFARRQAVLEAAQRSVISDSPHRQPAIHAFPLDATSADETASVMATAIGAAGQPTLLINCAGRAYPGRFEALPADALRETLDANVITAWNTTRALLPALKETHGRIVNTASMAAFVGMYGLTDYCASKFAVLGFSEALRWELADHDVGVTVLCPPDTDTPGFEIENRTKPPETKALSAAASVETPEAVAAALINGLRRGDDLVIPGRASQLIWRAKRFAPWFVDRSMRRTIRAAQG